MPLAPLRFDSWFRSVGERSCASATTPDLGLARDRQSNARKSGKPDLRGSRGHEARMAHAAQSIEMPLALIGAAHFAISASTKRLRYSGDRRSGATTLPPISLIRSWTAGVFIASTVASWSFLAIASGVSLGRNIPFQI